MCLVGQFPGLSEWHKPNRQFGGDEAPEDEAAGLHARDRCDSFTEERVQHLMYCQAHQAGILHQRRNILEYDAGFRKVRNVSNLGLESIHHF